MELAMQDDAVTTDEYDWGDEASTFGDRLARAREHAGMDQAELARRLGVRALTVRNWEADRSEPRANRLQMLCGLLNVSIIWLMTGAGEGVPKDADSVASSDLRDILAELRNLRLAQSKLAARAAQIEKKLRTLASN